MRGGEEEEHDRGIHADVDKQKGKFKYYYTDDVLIGILMYGLIQA